MRGKNRLQAFCQSAGCEPLPQLVQSGGKPDTITTVAADELPPERVTAALPGLEKYADGLREKTGVPGLAIAVVHADAAVSGPLPCVLRVFYIQRDSPGVPGRPAGGAGDVTPQAVCWPTRTIRAPNW